MAQLDVGTHLVRVANSQLTDGKDGKPPQLSIWFEDENGEGRAWYSSLGWKGDGTYSEAAGKFALDALANLGWDAEARGYVFEELNGPDSPIIGREAEIVVVNEVYEGQSRTKIKWINDPSRPRAGVERMEPQAAMTFAEKTRQALRQAGKNVPAARAQAPKPKPASAPPPAQGAESFDDIPF